MSKVANDPQTKADFAHFYAARGIRVFPVRPDTKVAAVSDWPAEATLDAHKIDAWWQANPDYNIGCAAGDGLAIVDADVKKNSPGLSSLGIMQLEGVVPADSFEVETPSGGRHVYVSTDQTITVRNSVNQLKDYPGIDIRGHRGYVLGAGSTVDGKPYSLRQVKDLQPAPTAFFAALKNRRLNTPEQSGQDPVASLDNAIYVKRAITWLTGSAPEAVEGAGGDHNTYKVAAQLKDFGISENLAFDLMCEYWNEEKASPPWDPVELQTKVANAYAYGTGAPGKSTAEADFGITLPEAYDIGKPPSREAIDKAHGKTTHEDFHLTPYIPVDPATLPRRDWLFGFNYIRKYVTVTVAPGGVGKSSLSMSEAMAMTSGRDLTGTKPKRPLKVSYWNLEDPYIEMQIRAAAAMQFFGLTADDIADRLFMTSGRDTPLKLAFQGKAGPEAAKDAVANLVRELRANSIDVLIVDPFVSMHSLSENDNAAMDMVVKLLGRIAEMANVAVHIVHHTRKGSAGNEGAETTAESSRGAKALIDGARDVRVLNRMSPDDAVKAGLMRPSEAGVGHTNRLYFRAYSDKMNMAPPAASSRWYKLENVKLINGDEVGVAVPWQWPAENFNVAHEDIAEVQRVIDAGEWKLDVRSGPNWAGVAIADVLHLDADNKAHKAQIGAILKAWIDRGWLKKRQKADPNNRMQRAYVVVGEWV